MSRCQQLLCESGIALLWRSGKRIAAPFKAQGRSLALSGNCSRWSPTCNVCWSDKIWRGWNCLGMYGLTLNLVPFSSWRWKRVFSDKIQEVGFHKECHCDCSCYSIVMGTNECPEQLFWWKQLNLLECGRGWGNTDSDWEPWKVIVSFHSVSSRTVLDLWCTHGFQYASLLPSMAVALGGSF